MTIWGILSIVLIGLLLSACCAAMSSLLRSAKILRDIFLYKLFDIEETSEISNTALTYKKVVKRFVPIIGFFSYSNVQYDLPANSQLVLQTLLILLTWSLNLIIYTELSELNIGAAIGVACCSSFVCILFTYILSSFYLSSFNLKDGTYSNSAREVHALDGIGNQTSNNRRGAFKTARVGESTFLDDKLNVSYVDREYCVSNKSRQLESLVVIMGAGCGLAGLWIVFKGVYAEGVVLETAFYASCIGVAVDLPGRIVACYVLYKLKLCTNYERVYKNVGFVITPSMLGFYKKTPCIQSQALIIDYYANTLNIIEQPFYKEDLIDSRQDMHNTPEVSYADQCKSSPVKFFEGDIQVETPKHDITEPDYENPLNHHIQPLPDEAGYSFIDTGYPNPEDTAESYQEYKHQDVSFTEFLLSPQKRLVDSPSPQKSLVFESSPSPAKFYLFEEPDEWHLTLQAFEDDEPEPLGEQDTLSRINSSTLNEENKSKCAFQRKIEFTDEEIEVKLIEIQKKSVQDDIMIEDVMESPVRRSQVHEPPDFITPVHSQNVSAEIDAICARDNYALRSSIDQLFENPIRVTDFTDFEDESDHCEEEFKEEDMKSISHHLYELTPTRELPDDTYSQLEISSDKQTGIESHSVENIKNVSQDSKNNSIYEDKVVENTKNIPIHESKLSEEYKDVSLNISSDRKQPQQDKSMNQSPSTINNEPHADAGFSFEIIHEDQPLMETHSAIASQSSVQNSIQEPLSQDSKSISEDIKKASNHLPPLFPREPIEANLSLDNIHKKTSHPDSHSIANSPNLASISSQDKLPEDSKVASMVLTSDTQDSNDRSRKVKKKKAKTKPPTLKTAHFLKQHTIDIYCSDPKLAETYNKSRARSHSNGRGKSKDTVELPNSRSSSVERSKPMKMKTFGPLSERNQGLDETGSVLLDRASKSAERYRPAKFHENTKHVDSTEIAELLDDRRGSKSAERYRVLANFRENTKHVDSAEIAELLDERKRSKSTERVRMQANFPENTKQIDSAELAELLDENSDAKQISIDAKVFKKRSKRALLKDAEELMKLSKSNPHGEDPQIQKLIQILASRQSFRKKHAPSKPRRSLPYSEAAAFHDDTTGVEKIVYLDHEFNLKQRQKLESVTGIYSSSRLNSSGRKSSREGTSRGRLGTSSPKENRVSYRDL